MKKVKKQWVVVSVATLAFLGTTAYTIGGNKAHADTKPETNSGSNSSGNTTTQSAGSSSSSSVSLTAASGQTSSSNQSSGTSASSSNSGTASSSKPVVNVGTTNGQAPSFNNNDDSSTYAQQIQQGYQDAFNGKANNSGTLTGQAINYYNAGYAAAAAVMNDYNQKTQGIGTGTQDYTYYGNTPNRKDDAGNVKSASLSSSGASLASNTAANSTTSNNSSSGAASSNGSGFTGASTTNPQTALTDGTPQNYNSPDSPYRGGADNPYSAYTSTQNYEQQLLSKFSNVNNVSVKSSNSIGAGIIPQSSDGIIQQARQQYANYAGLAKAFDTATI